MIARRAMRKDRNHIEIKAAFRAMGLLVDDVSALAGLGYDLLVCNTRGRYKCVEVKDPEQVPSKRTLTASEVEAQRRHGDHYVVVMTVDEAIEVGERLGLRF